MGRPSKAGTGPNTALPNRGLGVPATLQNHPGPPAPQRWGGPWGSYWAESASPCTTDQKPHLPTAKASSLTHTTPPWADLLRNQTLMIYSDLINGN